MTTSTSFAQMANKQSLSLSSALRANTPPTKGQTPSRKFLTLSIFFLLSFFCTTNAWGAEGDLLKTYNTASSTFSTGYGRKTGDNFVFYGQKGYFGTNKADTHNSAKPTAADLPVVKAHNSSATTSTTGLYYLYTSEAVANVGKVEISFTAKSGSSTVNAYIVSSSTKAASGSATWTKVTLASNSAKAQGANVASNGTYTFTFDATQTDAKYYGVVFATSSYWRATNLTFKLYEGATTPTCTKITPTLSYSSSTLEINGTANPTLTGNTGGGTVTYSSNNTDVATVNSSTGVVTAVAEGSATITASIAAKGAYCDGSATATISVSKASCNNKVKVEKGTPSEVTPKSWTDY